MAVLDPRTGMPPVIVTAPSEAIPTTDVGDGREGGTGWRSWLPTWKWWTSSVVGCTGLGVATVTAGHWTQTLSIAAITLVSQRVVAYITPNATR